MIFKPISDVIEKSDKDFLIELVSIYTRLVEVWCEKNNVEFTPYDVDVIEELKDIGIICDREDLPLLQKTLKAKYEPFINSVKFTIINKKNMNGLLDNLYNSTRKKKQELHDKQMNYNLVDFFCGAGGLSLGFIQEGFNVRLANDVENVCINTYMYNHPELSSNLVVKGDIREVVDNLDEYIDREIDVVVGGPPCQGFSEANRQRIIDDPRNQLYKYFIKAVEKIAPKFVVMENVKGMLKVADQVVEDYGNLKVDVNGETCSYLVAYKVLNSQYFSVAQSRERLIYIAIRSDVVAENGITPTSIFEQIDISIKNNPIYTLNDALQDIKPLEASRIKNTNEVDSEITGKKIDINQYEHHENSYLRSINMDRKIPYIYNHKARYVNDVNYEIYGRLNQGDDATDEKIKDIMPYAHRNHCFKDKYYKLRSDRPCRTITAHLRMDCHSHIHPFQVRSITPREAARVQSFPDDYFFLGAYLKTYMQIGNAVPTMMARGIARIIKQYLD